LGALAERRAGAAQSAWSRSSPTICGRGRGAPPAPHGVVGLRHWTIVIAPGDAAALRERVIAAGAPYEDTPEGLLVRDAWNIALRVAPT
jgi:hypothetical protein